MPREKIENGRRRGKVIENLPTATSLTVAYFIGVAAMATGRVWLAISLAGVIWFVLGAFQLGYREAQATGSKPSEVTQID